MRKVTQERRDQVLGMIQGGQKVSIEDVTNQLGMNPQSAANLLRDMSRDNLLARSREGRTMYYGEPQRRTPRRRRTAAAETVTTETAAEPTTAVEAPAANRTIPAASGFGAGGGAGEPTVQAAFTLESGQPHLELALGNARIDVDRGTADYLWRILGAFLSMPAAVAVKGRGQASRRQTSAPISTVPAAEDGQAQAQIEPSGQPAPQGVIPEAAEPETA